MKKILLKLKTQLRDDLKYIQIKSLRTKHYEKFLKNEYKSRTGKLLNIKEPRSFTEKMQYAKLYRNTPLKTELTDKYKVRNWVSDKIGSQYLIPLLGVWDNYDEINFDLLPSEFVLKTNHSSGWNLVVKEKNKINHRKEKIKFDKWMKRNFAYAGDLQLHYKDIEPKIIAEKYIEDKVGELTDYKFLCFGGKVYYCWIDVGRFSRHYRNVYDLNWELQPWRLHTYDNTLKPISKPKNFDKMVEIVRVLCEGFSHVRVDLYSVDEKIFFGEMTFTSESGYGLIYPEHYNNIIGELWDINYKENDY